METILNLFKGAAMGAAAVIPGVSGGTVAFITGIYERLINALKSFGPRAIRLGLQFRIKELWEHIDGRFLMPLGVGCMLSIFTLAKILEHTFEKHPQLTFAFFFGLIAASIFSVGKTVDWKRLSGPLPALTGTALAAALFFSTHLGENDSPWYLFVCGAAAICSMIVPGLSGSFVLLILGNYILVLSAVPRVLPALRGDGSLLEPLRIIVPVALGCMVGLLAFSHVISWVFRRHHNTAVALMTGFVAGSLVFVWPWKTEKHLLNPDGTLFLKDGETVVSGYALHWPDLGIPLALAILCAVIGAVAVWVMDRSSDSHS